MVDLSKYSTEELEAMLQDSPQPQSAQPAQTQAPQATQEPASDMPDLSQYSTEDLERMIGEQGTAEGRIEQMFNVGTDRRDEIDPLEEAAKGAGRAVKAIGGAFVGLGSGAVRLAGTPVRALTGWDGLHRVADAIDSGYEDWGSEALASELPDDDWGRVIGGFGEKMAGTAGSLGAMAAGGGLAKLGAAGKFGAASKAVGTAGAALQKSLPFMFGNDAAVRTYDTAKENGSGTARALGLASVNGAIHYLGFKMFENQSLNKMLGMPQEMTAMMPAWANAAREGGAKTFTELASGVRNGMFKYILAERAKGALKAGGIMGLQKFLSSVPTQMAEGAGVGDVDWGRAVSEGVGGVEEGALMEGLMGGAAMLKTPKEARKFIADTYFRNGYKLPNGQHVPGLLHSEEGRSFVMKQNPEMQRRILDILDHGGKVTKGELNAACLPPDMTEAELREFAKDWKHDLEVDGWRKGEDEFLGDGEELTGSDDVRGQNAATTAAVEEERIAEEAMNADAPRNGPAPPIDAAREERAEPLSAAEAEAQQRQLNDAAARNRAKQVARDAEPRIAALRQARQEEAEMGNRIEHQFDEANVQADAERNGAEQLAREEAYPRITVEQAQAARTEPSPVANGGAGTVLQEQIQRRIDAEARSEAGKKVQAEIDGFFDAVKGNRDVLGNEEFNARNADILAEVDDAIRRNNPQMVMDALNRLKKKIKNFAKKNRLRPATPEPPPEPPDGSEPSGGSKSNLLRRQQPRSATQSANSLRPAATRDELNQQPKEIPNETGNVPVEAQPEPPAQDAGRGGQQPPPQAAEGLVEGEAPRGEVPAAGEVETSGKSASNADSTAGKEPQAEDINRNSAQTQVPVSKSDNGGQKLTGGAKEEATPPNAEATPPATQTEPPAAEPPKNAPASAPRAYGTTTPPQSADAPQGAESAAGGATGGAAEEPKPTQGNKLRRGKKGKKLEAQEPKTDAAPATPEATTTPAPPVDEQTQPASQFRDKNGNMKKTLRGAVERIASAIGNRTGKGAITPEEADGIVNGIAESPDLKHNRTRQFFTPLVTDAEWQNSLGVDAESAKNIRDAVVRAGEASQRKKNQVKLDNAVRNAEAGDKDAPTAYGLVRIASDALDKARTKGDKAAEARAQKALDDANAKFNAEYEQVPEANRERWVKEQEKQFEEWSKKHDDVARNESVTADAPIPGKDGSSTTMAEQLPAKNVSSGDDRGGFKLVPWEDGELVRKGRVKVEMRLKSPTTGKMLSKTVEMTRTELAAKLGKNRAADLLGGHEILASVGAPETPADRDAKFAADADYQRWLKSRKANDAEPLRQRYEMEQAKALGDAFQNAVRGVDVEYVVDRDYDPARDNPNGGRELTERGTGRVLGIFDRDTGKLKLFRGASWKTLNHELGGHATMRLAEQEAARGNRALLDKINESIDNAPQWLKDEVKSRYPDADEATLRDEIWAALRERPSEAMQKYVKSLQGRKWYNRAWDAIKTAWRGILSRMGFNRADLSGIDKMTPDEFNEFLDKAMIGGKTLGRLETQDGEGIGNKLRKAFIGELGAEAGEVEKTVGIRRVDDAKKMEADGASREDIWRKTGWWKGKDGKWRVEIPDADFFKEDLRDLEAAASRESSVSSRMEDVIEAPELFKAYPELEGYTLEITKLEDGVRGECDTRNKIIRIDRDVLNMRSTLVHELQHAVQELEGFAKGSSDVMASRDVREFVESERRRIYDDPAFIKAEWEIKDLLRMANDYGFRDWVADLGAETHRENILDLLDGFSSSGHIYGETKKAFDSRLSHVKKDAKHFFRTLSILRDSVNDPDIIKAFYRNSAGEVESRNVQSRLDMSPEERAATPPWETEDVPESEQIVRTGDGGGASESRGGRQSSVRMARGPVTPGPDVRIMDDEVKWLDRQGERFVDSTHNLRKVQNEVGYRDRSDPKSVGVEEVMDPKTGFVDWRKSSDIHKAIVKSNGFVQKNEHILQIRRDRATREMAKMKGLSEDAKRELVDDYLTALHAEERNRTIADRRGDTYNDDYAEGAGRSAKWARDFIANDPNVQKYKAELDRIADIVHEVVVEDLRLRHENGLLSDDEYNFYSKKWKHYVPLRTDVTEGSPEGGVFNTSTATFNRSEYRTAKGRGADNIASSPFAFAFVQAHDGIGKSAKNIIGNVTANFIDMTEAKGLNSTKVEVVAKDGSKSTKTEYRIAEVVPADVVKRGGTKFAATFADGTTAEIGSDMRLASHQDNLVLFKRPEPVIGKDGKPTGETAARLYVAKFTEGKNGRGLAVAKAITGKNMVEVPFWVQPFSKATHFLSRMNTSASPSFLTSNIFNDRNEAWRAMSARFGVLDGAKMAAKVWKYRYADGKDLKNWLENGELRPGSDVADFINGGAAIKGGNIAQGFSGETSSLKDNLARQERKARSWWERFKRIGRFENVREIASSVGDVVQSANELEELGTRYGVYHAVLDELVAKGVPREVAKAEAVTFCRGATTDFNVRGTLAPVIGSFYMFYNANVQGTRRNIQSLTDKRGVQTFATLAGVASAMTVLRYWLGNDEEREKGGERNAKNALEYQKQSAMGIPIPSGRELSILKMRGVDALIPYAATKFTEAALYDDVSAMEALADSLKAAGGEALGVLGGNGVGNKSQISQTLAPSLADPFVQWATGTDWQGERRVKQLMDKTVPQSYNARHGTSDVFKWIAETVNDISRGNQYRKGVVDMAPEDVQLIVETLAGGLGRDITGAINTFSNVKEVAKGGSSERLFGRMPVVKSLVREYPDSTSRYFDALDEYNADKAEFKKTTELGRRAEMKKEHPYLTAKKGRVDTLIEQVQELTHRERGEVKVGQKWVPMKTELPEARKEAFRRRRLRLQAEVLRILGK